MKKMLLLATLLGGWPGLGLAQTMDDLLNSAKNTDNVLIHSMGFDRKSYSPAQADQANPTLSAWCRSGAPA